MTARRAGARPSSTREAVRLALGAVVAQEQAQRPGHRADPLAGKLQRGGRAVKTVLASAPLPVVPVKVKVPVVFKLD